MCFLLGAVAAAAADCPVTVTCRSLSNCINDNVQLEKIGRHSQTPMVPVCGDERLQVVWKLLEGAAFDVECS